MKNKEKSEILYLFYIDVIDKFIKYCKTVAM